MFWVWVYLDAAYGGDAWELSYQSERIRCTLDKKNWINFYKIYMRFGTENAASTLTERVLDMCSNAYPELAKDQPENTKDGS